MWTKICRLQGLQEVLPSPSPYLSCAIFVAYNVLLTQGDCPRPWIVDLYTVDSQLISGPTFACFYPFSAKALVNMQRTKEKVEVCYPFISNQRCCLISLNLIFSRKKGTTQMSQADVQFKVIDIFSKIVKKRYIQGWHLPRHRAHRHFTRLGVS